MDVWVLLSVCSHHVTGETVQQIEFQIGRLGGVMEKNWSGSAAGGISMWRVWSLQAAEGEDSVPSRSDGPQPHRFDMI